ncbi:hypothetical protein ACTQX5_02555 [Faecalicoccus sp. LCP19S3_E3]|uniref:hypothetical protein n=1 Tax=unclassified Faecalicoccus TaxID=2643311 RepID=UPI003F911A15
MKYRVVSIRPVGDIVVDEIEAESVEDARYKFYMDNPNSDISKIEEKVLDPGNPESERKVFEEKR